MSKKKDTEILTFYRRQLEAMRSRTQDNMVRLLSGGFSVDEVMGILDSLGPQLKSPPHYPVRVIMKLAGKLGTSVPQARLLWDYLEKAKLISYSCTFEAEEENQNKTSLEINHTADLSTATA
jgi:hypothetical protein